MFPSSCSEFERGMSKFVHTEAYLFRHSGCWGRAMPGGMGKPQTQGALLITEIFET
jgi:hypothetical protein